MLLRKAKKVTESAQLSELIKDIRNCKTKAEERAIINKEKSSIGQQLTVLIFNILPSQADSAYISDWSLWQQILTLEP